MNIVIDPPVPNDELRRTLYAGHLVILERPEVVNEAITSLLASVGGSRV